MLGAFQRNAFQTNAFQVKGIGLQLTDTQTLQLPIDAVLLGQQEYEIAGTVIERHDPNIKTRIRVSEGGAPGDYAARLKRRA